MALILKVTKDKAALADSGGGNFLSRSGVYDVTTKFVSLEQSEKGAISFNLNVDYNGNSQTIYGNTIQNTDGKVNEIGMKLLNKLFVIAGLEDGAAIETDTETHNVGKDNKPQEFTVIPSLSDLAVKIQVKEVFSKYNGEIKRSLEIYNFFDENGASASELAAQEAGQEVTLGDQLAKTLAKPATTQPTYKANSGTREDAPTEAEVKAWQEAKAAGKPAPKPATTTKPKGSLFK